MASPSLKITLQFPSPPAVYNIPHGSSFLPIFGVLGLFILASLTGMEWPLNVALLTISLLFK